MGYFGQQERGLDHAQPKERKSLIAVLVIEWGMAGETEPSTALRPLGVVVVCSIHSIDGDPGVSLYVMYNSTTEDDGSRRDYSWACGGVAAFHRNNS